MKIQPNYPSNNELDDFYRNIDPPDSKASQDALMSLEVTPPYADLSSFFGGLEVGLMLSEYRKMKQTQ
jgi:hypothetical protein